MITKNYINFIKTILTRSSSGSNNTGLLSITDTSGSTKYIAPSFGSSYPYNVTDSVSVSSLSTVNGIWIGSGTTQPTENDYKLSSRITSGISANVTHQVTLDSSGNPQKQYTITATNTSASPITISEIGYVQSINALSAQSGGSSTSVYALLDRTLLDTPVTIAADDYAVIRYTLKTIA